MIRAIYNSVREWWDGNSESPFRLVRAYRKAGR